MSNRRGGGAFAGGASVAARVTALAGIVCLFLFCSCARALAAGDANRPVCSSELEGFPGVTSEQAPGFRAFMPDCRAYELVTPAYDDGAELKGVGLSYVPYIARNGEHVLAEPAAGFAGAENMQVTNGGGTAYVFSRTPAGWSAEALDPPASVYPAGFIDAVSADFSRSLWQVSIASHSGDETPREFREGADTLVIRQGAGAGRFSVVGPATAPGHDEGASLVRGVSATLTHILLGAGSKHGRLWSGDETLAGDESLYEYSEYEGAFGPEPVLVGVENEGAPPWEASAKSVNDGAELVSQCGAQYRAVSAEGDVVYFTALAADQGPGKDACNEAGEGRGPALNELYTRIDGERTLDISEPPLSTPGRQCTGECETDQTDVEDRREASFQGASEDGSKAFITTTQRLVNGATEEENGLYEETIAKEGLASHVSSLTLVAPDVSGVESVSEDGARVYFESPVVLASAANAKGEVRNGNEEEAKEGQANVYVYDTRTGSTAFVAQEMTNIPAEGQQPVGPNTTRNGRFLVFYSPRHFTGTDDRSTIAQLFEYDAETGQIVRVSAGQRSPGGYECEATHAVEEGFNCDGNTTSEQDSPWVPATPTGLDESWQQTTVAEDGTVVFTSRLALTRRRWKALSPTKTPRTPMCTSTAPATCI